MKKVLFAFLLLIPFMVRAVENVKITNIEQIEKSETVTVNNEPTFEGLKINFDFKFTNLEDFVKYKVTIKNEDNKDYEIESGVSFNEGEFIKYEFGLNGDSAIIKPNETKEMTLQITYEKEPSPDKFVDGKYVEQNSMSIDLSTKDGQKSSVDPASQKKEDNPKTGAKGIILLIAVLLGTLLLIFFFEKKNAFFLIALFLLVPMTIYAIEKITIEIETKIEIEALEKTFVYNDYNCGHPGEEIEFKYQNGMTFKQWKESKYYTEAQEEYEDIMNHDRIFYFVDIINAFNSVEYTNCVEAITPLDENETNQEVINAYNDAVDNCGSQFSARVNEDSVIMSKEKGYYYNIGACER